MSAALLTSCGSIPEEGLNGRTVRFRVEEDLRGFEEGETRGMMSDVFCTDESGIGEIFLAAYSQEDGKYCGSVYIDNPQGDLVEMELEKDKVYTVYTLVNMGETIPPPTEEEMKGFVYSLPYDDRVTDDMGYLPMCGTASFDSGAPLDSPVSIFVRRLVSEITVSYQTEGDLRLLPQTVRLANVPLQAGPFTDVNAGTEMSPEGDYATESDMAKFIDGGQIRMFMLENMNCDGEAGDIDAGMTEPSPGTSWLEMSGRIENSLGIITADIRYRIPLDFRIERNKRYNISFKITDKGVFEDSWRVTVTEATLDMGTDILYARVNGAAKVMPPAGKYTDLTYSVGNKSIATIDRTGLIRAKAEGKTTVYAHSKILNASGSVPLEVVGDTDDKIHIDNTRITLGATKSIPYFANNGSTAIITTADGPLRLDITADSKGQVRTAEDSYLRISFNPAEAAAGICRLNVTVKKAIPGSDNVFSGILYSKYMSMCNFIIRTQIPELTVNLNKTTVCETGEYAIYSTGLLLNGNSIGKEEFDPELYDEIYGNIVARAAEESGKTHIETEVTGTGTGKIYGMEADGKSDCKVKVDILAEGFFGQMEQGRKQVTITVTPAFYGNGGSLADISNTVLCSHNGKCSSALDIPGHEINGATRQVRKVGWDRTWEKGTAASADEVRSIRFTLQGFVLDLGPEAAGPYKLRLEKRNLRNGKKWEVFYDMDIYLVVEVGIHFPWSESMMYTLDLETVYNAHRPTAGEASCLDLLEGRQLLEISPKYGSGQMVKTTIGEMFIEWNNRMDFFYNDSAHAQLPFCVNFLDSIALRFSSGGLKYYLYNPFAGKRNDGNSFRTDRNVADRYFSGKVVLMEIRLASSPLYTITHSGCSNVTGYYDGQTETNRY